MDLDIDEFIDKHALKVTVLREAVQTASQTSRQLSSSGLESHERKSLEIENHTANRQVWSSLREMGQLLRGEGANSYEIDMVKHTIYSRIKREVNGSERQWQDEIPQHDGREI